MQADAKVFFSVPGGRYRRTPLVGCSPILLVIAFSLKQRHHMESRYMKHALTQHYNIYKSFFPRPTREYQQPQPFQLWSCLHLLWNLRFILNISIGDRQGPIWQVPFFMIPCFTSKFWTPRSIWFHFNFANILQIVFITDAMRLKYWSITMSSNEQLFRHLGHCHFLECWLRSIKGWRSKQPTHSQSLNLPDSSDSCTWSTYLWN